MAKSQKNHYSKQQIKNKKMDAGTTICVVAGLIAWAVVMWKMMDE